MSGDLNQKAASPFEVSLPKKAALLTTVGLIFAGLVFLFIETYNMMPSILPGYPGDAFFPRLILGYSLLFAAIILVRGTFLPQDAAAVGDEDPYFKIHWLEFASVCVLIAAYAALLHPIGFEIATFLFTFALLTPRLIMPPVRAILIGAGAAAVTTLLLYACFVLLLKVHAPLLFLPRYVSY